MTITATLSADNGTPVVKVFERVEMPVIVPPGLFQITEIGGRPAAVLHPSKIVCLEFTDNILTTIV